MQSQAHITDSYRTNMLETERGKLKDLLTKMRGQIKDYGK